MIAPVTQIVRNSRLNLIKRGLKKNWKILDLGCGDMWLTNYLNENGFKCIGLDVYPRKDKNYIRGSAEKIPFPNNTFDCIIAFEVIEHVRPKSYSEIKRVLKPNGKLILTTPKPQFDFIITIMQKFGLLIDTHSPHINLVNLEDLPFELKKSKRFYLIGQYGVLTNKK